MAETNLSYKGDTGVLGAAVISITENVSKATETTRNITLAVSVSPRDYSGARSFSFNASVADKNNSNSGQSLDGSGYTIFNDSFDVSVPYGSSEASIDFSFSASVYSSTKRSWMTISGGATKVTGLSVKYGVAGISSAATVDIGKNCSVTWTPMSASHYFTLTFGMKGWSHTTDRFCPNTKSSYTYSSYTIPNSVANLLPDDTSGVINVVLTTYPNSWAGSIGTSSGSFTVRVPSTAIPTVSNQVGSIVSSNSFIAGLGRAIAGYSSVTLQANGAGVYGSKITKFTIRGGTYNDDVPCTANSDGSASLNYSSGGVISSSGQKKFTITCTDSRNRVSAAKEVTVSFSAYTTPSLDPITMDKVTVNGAIKIAVTASWTYDSMDGNNSTTAKVQYKLTTAQNWTTHSGALTNGKQFTLSSLTPNKDSSYNVRVVVTDRVGNSSEKTAFVATETVLLDFKAGGEGLGVGKKCESNRMEVAMPAVFYNGISVGSDEQLLDVYIRNVMNHITENIMYGSAFPQNPSKGRIFFKKI